MFLFDGVVLKKQKLRENLFLLILFTKDFWKIRAFFDERKTRPVDIGHILSVKVEAKNASNRIKEYSLKKSIPYHGCSYNEIVSLLSYFHLVETLAPEWLPYVHVFEDILLFMKNIEDAKRDKKTLSLLARLRLTILYGIHKKGNPALEEILGRLRASEETEGLSEKEEILLETHIKNCVSQFLHSA